MDFDVIVIGLGPAGAHFSSIVSELGYNVLSLERKTKKRYKTCAGGVSPLSFKILKRTYGKIPSNIIERKIHKVLLSTNDDNLLLDFPKIKAFTTYRSKLDSWLLNEAADRGTVAKEKCEPIHIQISSDSVKVKIREKGALKEFTSNCLIGAYGSRSSIQKNLGVDSPESLMAVQYELDFPKNMIDEFGDMIRFYYSSNFSKTGCSWIFPKKNYVTVGLLDSLTTPNLKEKLKHFISENLLVSKKFDLNLFSHNLSSAFIPNEILSRTYGERFMCIGDAAGFSDRITWEGISFALRSAELAANTFNCAYDRNDFSIDQLSNYQKKWKSNFGIELEFGKKLQRIMFNKNLDKNWSRAIKQIKEDDKLRKFLIDEYTEHISFARAISRLPFSKKIRLLSNLNYSYILNFLID